MRAAGVPDGTARGPYFEELSVGDVYDEAPAMTLDDGLAAVHRSIVGDRMKLPLDTELSRLVTGRDRPLAHPALAWNVSIGQSTLVTQNVVANLFYRALVFHRLPSLGDTLRTVTEVVGLRQNSRKPGRTATGLAALRVTTVDQRGDLVLDFWRCAMLPLLDQDLDTGRRDSFDDLGEEVAEQAFGRAVDGWRIDEFRRQVRGPHSDSLAVGQRIQVSGGDVVSSAPELARLTLNVAEIHHDNGASPDGRLVYGGHTIAVALSQATRALPNLVAVTGWHGCDHTGPVREGDTLHSTVEVERLVPAQGAGTLAHLRSVVHAHRRPGEPPRPVLDWRYVALVA